MEIDNSVFNKQKIKLCNLNCGETFLYDGNIFMRSVNDEYEIFATNLSDGRIINFDSDTEVELIKTKLTLT